MRSDKDEITLWSLLVLFESVIDLRLLLRRFDRSKALRMSMPERTLSYRVLHILGKTLVLLQCFMNGFFVFLRVLLRWFGHCS